MMNRTAAALIGLVASAAPALAGCPTTNLMPEFLAFRDATASLPPTERASRFVTEIAAKHPEYFKSDIFGSDAELTGYAQRLLDPASPEQFATFGPLSETKFKAMSDAFPRAYAEAEARFTATFPDFTCQTPILFGPSFARFAGSGGTGPDGVFRMRFGVDMLAMMQAPSDLPVLFSHELFHVYHNQALGKRQQELFGTVWWGAWIEGLASYVSYRITPGATPKQALAWPVDLYDRMQAPGAMKLAAATMLRDMDGKGATYGTWFHMNKSVPGLPSCAGYYMGFRIAEGLAKKHSVQQLARMTPDELKPLVQAYLAEEANRPK